MRAVLAALLAVAALAGCASLACRGPFDVVYATWREPGLYDRLPDVVAQDVILLEERIVRAGLPLADEAMARDWGRYQVSFMLWSDGGSFDELAPPAASAGLHRGPAGEARAYVSVLDGAPDAATRAALDAFLANVTTAHAATRALVVDAAMANRSGPAGESPYATFEADVPLGVVDLGPLYARLGGRDAASVVEREASAQLDWPGWRASLDLPSRSATLSHDYADRTTTRDDGEAPDYELSVTATDHVWLQRVGQAPIAMDEAELRQWVVERFAHMGLPPPALEGWRVTRPSCE